MQKFLVIDSGGSKTIAVIFDKNGHILGQGLSKGGNSYSVGEENAISNVLSAYENARKKAMVEANEIKKTYLFIPGFRTCLEKFNQITGLNAEIKNEIDELKFASFENENGIIILSGTGSFGCAFVDGKQISIGGWGDLLGDEGSAYDIGLTFLKKCIKLYDCEIESRAIEQVLNFYGLNDLIELRHKFSNSQKTREEIGALAKLVTDLAEKNLKIAKDTLFECIDKLVDMSIILYDKSKLDVECNVALFGGVKKAGNVVTDYFANQLIEASHGKLKYYDCKQKPYQGGIKMMLNELVIK